MRGTPALEQLDGVGRQARGVALGRETDDGIRAIRRFYTSTDSKYPLAGGGLAGGCNLDQCGQGIG